jgi:hypothetical protein
MLRPSFVPPPEIRALRRYTRQLLHLAQDRARCWQRLEKTLEDALCKLTSVISRLAGPVSARAMTEAMTAGERGPEVLAGLALTRMAADGAAGTATFLGERHRRLSSRPGGGGHPAPLTAYRHRQAPGPVLARGPSRRTLRTVVTLDG